MGAKKPFRNENEAECLAALSCNGAASPREGQSIIDLQICAKQTRPGHTQSVTRLEVRFKRWTRPQNKPGSNCSNRSDAKQSELIAENMFLRQQLIVLERQVSRLQLKQRDRQILVTLASREHYGGRLS